MPLWKPAFPGSFPEASDVEKKSLSPVNDMFSPRITSLGLLTVLILSCGDDPNPEKLRAAGGESRYDDSDNRIDQTRFPIDATHPTVPSLIARSI